MSPETSFDRFLSRSCSARWCRAQAARKPLRRSLYCKQMVGAFSRRGGDTATVEPEAMVKEAAEIARK